MKIWMTLTEHQLQCVNHPRFSHHHYLKTALLYVNELTSKKKEV